MSWNDNTLLITIVSILKSKHYFWQAQPEGSGQEKLKLVTHKVDLNDMQLQYILNICSYPYIYILNIPNVIYSIYSIYSIYTKIIIYSGRRQCWERRRQGQSGREPGWKGFPDLNTLLNTLKTILDKKWLGLSLKHHCATSNWDGLFGHLYDQMNYSRIPLWKLCSLDLYYTP